MEEGDLGDKAVTPAGINGMPGSKSQASLGGTSPRTINKDQILNNITFEVQQTQQLLGELDKYGDEEEEGPEEIEKEKETWVKEAREEDNERYRRHYICLEDWLHMETRRKRDKELSWATN